MDAKHGGVSPVEDALENLYTAKTPFGELLGKMAPPIFAALQVHRLVGRPEGLKRSVNHGQEQIWLFKGSIDFAGTNVTRHRGRTTSQPVKEPLNHRHWEEEGACLPVKQG